MQLKTRILQFYKRKKYILLSPLTALAIMCVFYAIYGIFPFGSKTAAWCDMNQQTIPLLMDLKDVLDGKSSIFYTAQSGGGMNFWGVFLFFLASPFYLAVKFVAKQDVSYFATVLFTLKIALCAFTASLYFSSAYKMLDRKYIVLFGVIYAFCGYGLMYYQTLVWLDVMYMFPLLVMSVDRLCTQNKNGFFIFAFSATVALNYYLAFMVVIYLLISVPLYIYLRCEENTKKIVSFKFLASSLAAALITAPVWLCSLIQVGKSARGTDKLAKFVFEPPWESLKDKLCVIMGCAFIFAALLFAIKNPALKTKRFKYNLILSVFLMIPVLLDPINKIWHGGGYQSFPLRFGYMIVFTILAAVCEIYEKFPRCEKSKTAYCVISFVVLVLTSLLAFYIAHEKKTALSSYTSYLHITDDFFEVIFGLFILSFSVCVFYITLLRKKLIGSNIFTALISGVVLTEIFVNMSVYVGTAAKNDAVFDTTMTLENCIANEDFYRVKTEKKYTHVNMLGALGLKSYGHYTSLNPEDYLFAMKKLGYSSYWMETGTNGGTVITDALLGMKYSVGNSYDFCSYQKTVDNPSDFIIAENQLCVPAGVILKEPPELAGKLELTTRYDVQRLICYRFFGSDRMLEKYEHTSVTGGVYKYSDDKHNISISDPDNEQCRLFYDLKIKGHKTLYFDLFDAIGNAVSEPFYNSVKIIVNGTIINKQYPDQKNNGLLKLGEFENEEVEIKVIVLKAVSVKSFGVFGVDIDMLSDEIEKLKTAELSLDKNVISADCFADEKNTFMYLAVPWDSGFDVRLNGKKTTLYKVNDCFSAVKLDEGENHLKMTFYPKGFKASLILMILGAVFSTFVCGRKNEILNNEKIGFISIVLCRTAFLSAVIMIYIISVIIYIAGIIIRF